MGQVKIHNSKKALAAKIQLRENVLTMVMPAHVLDAFCGPTGEMHAHVWHRADSYLGVDSDWLISDRRRRMVCDNRLALRALDLSRFNIFDLDAFGHPWEQAIIVAARRRWKKGERGALLLTSGGERNLSSGTVSRSVQELLGTSTRQQGVLASSRAAARNVTLQCIDALLLRMGVKQIKRWEASCLNGGQTMFYAAIAFEGNG
jgi:hypothetical protein